MVSMSKFELWGDLPNEMRTECIKRMDFKTRMQLRAASKQDKLLVDSAPKYHFDRVIAELNVKYVPRVSCKNLPRLELNFEKELGPAAPEFFEKAYQRLAQILKFSNAETIDFSLAFTSDEDVSKFLTNISDSAPFRFKNAILNCEKAEIIDFFLKNCNSLESINLSCGTFDEARLIEIINFPSVINTKTVQLLIPQLPNFETAEIPYQLIKNWLDKEALELGKTLQIRIYDDNFKSFLDEKFENRVVSKTDKSLRIRTNDSTKHILIRPVESYHHSFLVIPSDKNETEFKLDYNWVSVINTKSEARNRAQWRARAAWYWATGYESEVEFSDHGDEEDEEDEEDSFDDFV